MADWVLACDFLHLFCTAANALALAICDPYRYFFWQKQIFCTKRLIAAQAWDLALRQNFLLTGQKDPGAPRRAEESKTRTYKTKSETENKKGVFSTIVLVLLGISVVVPMLQYWGYTSKE